MDPPRPYAGPRPRIGSRWQSAHKRPQNRGHNAHGVDLVVFVYTARNHVSGPLHFT